jgi:uncharacterized Ntn-hydrolase superfamily protein
MLQPSTFSIVAYDAEEDAWGIAVASKFLAVGAVVPWARAGAGAVATQSYANTAYGAVGLELMASGLSAQETLSRLLATDPQADQRQVGLVDAHGGAATFTGSACHPWAGGLTGDCFAVQGNILTGEDVILKMAAEFSESKAKNIIWRLYGALVAGDRAGGDRRGRQSAAILVVKPKAGYGGFNDIWAYYRVDDDPDPVHRLGELLELHDLYFGESPASERVALSGEPLRRLQEIMKTLGYYTGPLDGQYDAPTRAALDSFTGNENLEERVDLTNGSIDRPVIDYLIRRYK